MALAELTEEPFYAVAEIHDETIRGNEEQCGQCNDRFRCWTNKRLVVTIRSFTVNRDITGHNDTFRFTTNRLPECFRCGNMVSKEITIQTSHGNMMHGHIASMVVEATEFGMTAQIQGYAGDIR